MALGPHEAAAIMGVHYTIPQRMLDRGWIVGRDVQTAGDRRYCVFDGRSCQENYEEYDAKVVARGGMNDRRPRAWLHLREPMIDSLSAEEVRIAFEDAISAEEAAEILHVHRSFVPRLAKEGEIVGRLCHGRGRARASTRRVWIFSRKSCLENLAKARAVQLKGGKVGRPRNLS